MDGCMDNLGGCIVDLFRTISTSIYNGVSTALDFVFQNKEGNNADNADWRLSTCCGPDEIVFISLFLCFFLANYCLWNTMFLKPMKLLAVFVHEMSHAVACWLTCGRVLAIRVFHNEGGVTKYQGGNRCCIIPAGYLGCAFWGAVFVALSGDRIGSTVVASIMSLALLISLCFAPNKVMVWLCIGFIFITVTFIFLEWYVFSPLLNFITLYYGVSIGTFSVYDIHDDLIIRSVEGSDAYACYRLIPCCLPRCVGVQFIIIAIIFQILGVYLALVWLVMQDAGQD